MRLFKIIYILAVVAFSLTNFVGLGAIGFLSRFAALALLGMAVFAAAGRSHSMQSLIVLGAFGVFVLWSLTTAFWSENFWLTMTKLPLYAFTVTGLFIGGFQFARVQNEKQNPFFPFQFVLVPTVLASLPSLLTGAGFMAGNFRGITGNSNTLGATIALCSPWLLWEFRDAFESRWRKLWLFAFGVLSLVMLVLSHSRASLGALSIILLISMRNLNLGRRLLFLYSAALAAVLLFVMVPKLYQDVYSQYVLKRSDTLVHSREDQFQSSWDAAREGGVTGAGFGVSIGMSRYWNFSKFSTSAREKGSTQLAVVEETGLVGFTLYLAMLLAIAFGIRNLMMCDNLRGQRIGVLALAFFVAAVFHSMFEAWFFAIGPETAYFWATLGLTFGSVSTSKLPAPVPAMMRIAIAKDLQKA